jgi:hypothetical protein
MEILQIAGFLLCQWPLWQISLQCRWHTSNELLLVALVTAKILNDESFRQRIELKMSFFNFVTGGKSFGL